MLKPVRIEAGLGDPPKEYLSNDPESANFITKHSLQFDPKKPQEFIQEVKKIVDTQYRNEDCVVFGKGMYKVSNESTLYITIYVFITDGFKLSLHNN